MPILAATYATLIDGQVFQVVVVQEITFMPVIVARNMIYGSKSEAKMTFVKCVSLLS